MFRFGAHRPLRRASLTPLIDVVFLLLVFFMLAAQFSRDAAIPVLAAGVGAAYAGPPRLVEVGPAGLWLNGSVVAPEALVAALEPLMAGPEDVVVLRGREGAALQDLIVVADLLRAAGLIRLAVVE